MSSRDVRVREQIRKAFAQQLLAHEEPPAFERPVAFDAEQQEFFARTRARSPWGLDLSELQDVWFWAFCFDAESYVLYTAVMLLRDFDQPACGFGDSVLSDLSVDDDAPRRLRQFDEPQRAAILAYAEYLREEYGQYGEYDEEVRALKKNLAEIERK